MTAANTTARPAQPKAPGAKAGKKKTGMLLALFLAMPVALLLLPSTLVLIPAMIPTLVARVVDPAPGRHLTITVGSLNFAGSLWFMRDLWTAGQAFSAVLPTLSDMLGWLSALLGAGLGWAIYSMMPGISRRLAAAGSAARLNRLRKAQEELADQWGEPVRNGAPPPA
jgi:hypothetical protein